ncbi:hypothetical protein HGP05_02495 [Streptococcus sanguinis]|uniref:Uncharacterized protein n=1 Tax=Streptococcus sanguinis TaxID=1305 RepID=A0A7Y0VB71_STRSA|nr:hypothetical protein [Streptococcus sanguinis]
MRKLVKRHGCFTGSKDVEDTEKQLAADKDALIQAQEVVNNIDGDRSKKRKNLLKLRQNLLPLKII